MSVRALACYVSVGLIWGATLGLLVQCVPLPPEHPDSDPVPVPDAGCATMCLHLSNLGCPEADGPCLETCENMTALGVDPHTECVSGVTSCDQVDRASSHGCSP